MIAFTSPLLHTVLMSSSRRGFTLIELVIIVGVILILAGAIYAAIDPLKRLAQTRNSRRSVDIESVAKAGALRVSRAEPLSVDYDPMTWQMIGTATEGCDMLCGPSYALHTNKDLMDTSASNYVKVPKEFYDFDMGGRFSASAWVTQKQSGSPLYAIMTNDTPPFTIPRRGFTFGWFLYTPTLSLYEETVNQGANQPGGGIDLQLNPLDLQVGFYSDEVPWQEIVVEEGPDGESSDFGVGIRRHLTFSYDGTDEQNPVVKLYYDGRSINVLKQTSCVEPGCTPPSNIDFASGEDFSIGTGLGGSFPFVMGPLRGLVDDVRIYDGILTDEEVQKIFDGEKFSDRPGLTMKGRWTFNEPPGYREGYAKNEVDSQFDGVYEASQSLETLPNRVASFSIPGGAETLPVCFDIAPDLQQQDYLSDIPFDPKIDPTQGITGYAINRIGGSIVTRACNAEGTGPMASGEPPLIEVAH